MKIKAWGPAFALLALVFVAAAGLFIQQPKQTHFVQPTKSEQQHSVAREAASKNQTVKDDSEGDEETLWYNTFLEHMPDWFVALFTGFLTIVTWRLVVSTNKLWEAGERQLKVGQASVDAAVLSYQVAATTAERQLRAYVGVQSIYFRTLNDQTAAVVVEITNFGQTPAHNFDTSLRLLLRPHPLQIPIAAVLTPMQPDKEHGSFSLMPGAKSIVICEIGMTNVVGLNNPTDTLRRGDWALYLNGSIFYRDIFGFDHVTHVRQRARGARMDSNSPFIIAEDGNESD